MSTDIVHTAFDAPQRELGCEFMDWEGWLWPNHFGDPVAEHRLQVFGKCRELGVHGRRGQRAIVLVRRILFWSWMMP